MVSHMIIRRSNNECLNLNITWVILLSTTKCTDRTSLGLFKVRNTTLFQFLHCVISFPFYMRHLSIDASVPCSMSIATSCDLRLMLVTSIVTLGEGNCDLIISAAFTFLFRPSLASIVLLNTGNAVVIWLTEFIFCYLITGFDC